MPSSISLVAQDCSFTVQRCRAWLLDWWGRERHSPTTPLFPDLFEQVAKLISNDPSAANAAEHIKLYEQVRRRSVGLPSEDCEQDVFKKLTRQQEQLIRFLQRRDGHQASIPEAMRAMNKRPASKTERRSFLTTIRRTNDRFAEHRESMHIELDRKANAIRLHQC
jgi:hypothetical protein